MHDGMDGHFELVKFFQFKHYSNLTKKLLGPQIKDDTNGLFVEL
jgi:hypothetical protein